MNCHKHTHLGSAALRCHAALPASGRGHNEGQAAGSRITEAYIKGRLETLGGRAFPAGIILRCDAPATLLLMVQELDLETLPIASWNDQSDV